jgi:hypothetical protein
MRLAILIAFLMALGLGARADPAAWRTVVAPDRRASVEMPEGTEADPAGNQWVYSEGDGFALLFQLGRPSPDNPGYAPENRAAMLSQIQASVQARFAGSVLEHEEILQRGSFLGRALVLSYDRKGTKMIYNGRLFIGDARLVQVIAVTSAAQRNDPRIVRFLDSLTLP